MTKLVTNPDYTNYNAAWNAAYHDYDMSEAEINERLGTQPKRYAELNCVAQVANLAHQNRSRIKCPFAVKYYDALMNGDPFPQNWIDLGLNTGHEEAAISLPEHDRWVADLAELDDMEATQDAAAGRHGY